MAAGKRAQPGAKQRVVVIGAGMVGVCCALWLSRQGHRVLLADGNPPGSGTSSGNACTIAVHACVPVNRPALLLDLPKLLYGQNRPLTMDPLYAARHWPWFFRFLKHCRRQEVAKTTAALGQILSQAQAGLKPLIEMARCARLLDNKGCLYAYPSEQDYLADQENMRVRRAHGVRWVELSAAELRELEPNLKINFTRAVFFEHASRVLNPLDLTRAFFACYQRNGGQWRPQNVTEVVQRSAGLEARLDSGEAIAADKIVVAGGAFSTRIAGCGAERLPLGVERGYHVQFNGRQGLASRPVCWVGSGFYATPTSDGLRFAGTVEMAGLSPRKNPKILDYMTRMAKRMFALEGEPDQTWLGFRPTLPDSLPVIGPSPRSSGPQCDNILFAFGHQHLGLTLAGITGQLIAQLIDGQPTAMDLAPFSAERFL